MVVYLMDFLTGLYDDFRDEVDDRISEWRERSSRRTQNNRPQHAQVPERPERR